MRPRSYAGLAFEQSERRDRPPVDVDSFSVGRLCGRIGGVVTNSPRPGLSVGPTSEFSLFFQVKPGEGAALRSALLDLQNTPGYRPGDYGMAVQTIHEARFVLFDDDTRLAFITSFDGAVGLLHGGLLHLGADPGVVRPRSSGTPRATPACRTWRR